MKPPKTVEYKNVFIGPTFRIYDIKTVSSMLKNVPLQITINGSTHLSLLVVKSYALQKVFQANFFTGIFLFSECCIQILASQQVGNWRTLKYRTSTYLSYEICSTSCYIKYDDTTDTLLRTISFFLVMKIPYFVSYILVSESKYNVRLGNIILNSLFSFQRCSHGKMSWSAPTNFSEVQIAHPKSS